MPRLPVRLAAAAALAAASSASAIDLGFGLLKKKPNAPTSQPAKNDPALRLKQLLATLQSDPDIDRRKAAAEELKSVDPRGSAELLPVLVGAIQKDPSPAVRLAAVEALGAIKTPNPAVGAALDAVEKSDPDSGVRAAARAATWQYQVNSQKVTGTTPGSIPGQSGEPPFARPPATAKPSPTATEPAFRPITQGPGKGGVFKETVEPPFAKPKLNPAPRPVDLPAPAIVAPPLPMPVPKNPPTIPVPTPLPPAKPGELPPLSIPAAPPVIVAPPPGTGLPTIIPPGGGK